MKRWLVMGTLVLGLAGCGNDEATTSACEVEPTISVYNAATEETLFQEQSVCLGEDATVLDALEATDLEIDMTGDGDMAYVTGVEGIEEQSAGQASGWVYSFNGTPGDEGAGAKEVTSTDVIQWRFEEDAISFFE